MNARMIARMETAVQIGAAGLLAAAVAFATHRLLPPPFGDLGLALGSGLVAFLLCVTALRFGTGPRSQLKVPVFDLREFEPFELDELLLTDADRMAAELVLTDADRLPKTEVEASEPLVLDDVLAAVGTNSRVVRLFDRKAMPTPGQLNSTIERHLDKSSRPQNDASQALSDALAELRRSLR